MQLLSPVEHDNEQTKQDNQRKRRQTSHGRLISADTHKPFPVDQNSNKGEPNSLGSRESKHCASTKTTMMPIQCLKSL